MSASGRAHSEPEEVVFELEKWRQFGLDYRAEFDFCRILQTDYFAASDQFFANPMQPEARALVRCFGSLIDGLTGSMRKITIATCKLFGHPLNPFLQDKVEERGINTYNRIYTTYRLLAEFLPHSPLASTNDRLWDDLHHALEIRNRIVHPKGVRDLEISGADALLVVATGDEFSAHVNKFSHWLMQKEQKLIGEHTVERKRIYPKIGRNEKCPCGSGEKYKDCCIAAAIAA